MTFRRVAIASALVLSALGCSAQQLGLPRTPVSAVSPDGRYVAVVRNHASIDPPSQSLWVGERDGPLQKIKQLGEDVGWCNLVVWSADSSTVSFAVMDAELVTVDARSKRVLSEERLVSGNDYPPAKILKQLALSKDGRNAFFRECPRGASSGDECSEPMTRTIR